MRVFIAIDIPSYVRKRVGNIINEIKGKNVDIKLVKEENLHITLKFLGEIDNETVENVNEVIKTITSSFEKFNIKIKGLGFFGTPNFIRVVWLDLDSGKETIVNMIEMLNKYLKYIKADNYPPSPHITIGRVRSNKNRKFLLKIIEKYKNVEIGKFLVEKIALKRSILTKNGPIYTTLKTFHLK